ncbi:MAG TPA: SGNH/GDSL hydrolase family protein [Candidatus Eisenbergiella merdipullorum]|uniref:SGNH/GDSL hydrolase family protein n=1 Tax=Candidatus Eisenbergiella merdipullorum TaxID=2838553 RepID=A0A9D2L1J9_9FIRM|nr:SGNH/GDSL hydrolase family protein [Candidatus Eisenbergiella merdipullorum]
MAITERLPKVLLIGDSIKIGYSPFVKEELKDTAQTVYLQENGRFSAFVLRMLYDCYHSPDIGTDVDLIYWNCGLWDVLRIMGDGPQTTIGDYQTYLKRIIKRMRKMYPDAKMIFALTTPVLEGESPNKEFIRYNKDIRDYNRAAQEIMSQAGIQTDDLYQITVGLPREYHSDWTHYTQEGYQYIARHVAETIKAELGKEKEE